MFAIQYLPPAERYLKKLKDKNLKKQYLEAIKAIRMDPSIGNAIGSPAPKAWRSQVFFINIGNHHCGMRLAMKQDINKQQM